jgi:aspartyl-tRNA(Asn)/glutamyl-tRNA(Gln) amidotransferase subunit A
MTSPSNLHSSFETQMHEVLAQTQSPQAAHVFTQIYQDSVLAQARRADELSASGAQLGALHGMVISLKDNFDVAGETTLAGTVVCKGEPAATQDAVAVARLREAGALFVGKTNMSEFAFSGVGINPHHGTPRNPSDLAFARVPGGSSAGAAVSVALGLARAGLGTDTGGSIRIPAALCGLVGFKGTQSRIPRDGVMELSRTLDTVGVITRSVGEALAVDAVLSQQPLPSIPLNLKGLRFAVPQTLLLEDMQAEVAQAFAKALSRLSAAGAKVVDVAFSELADIAPRSLPGGFSPVEGYAAHHARLARAPEKIDPRVAARMALGKGVSASDYLGLLDRRKAWISQASQTLQGFDALLCPTVPMVAPLMDPLVADDEAFFTANRLLLRNPATINYLDGCAISLPCHALGDLPVGLMVSCLGGQDARLAQMALAIEPLLQRHHSF